MNTEELENAPSLTHSSLAGICIFFLMLGVGSAVAGCSSPKKATKTDGVGGQQTTMLESIGPGLIGITVSFDDSSWEVISAREVKTWPHGTSSAAPPDAEVKYIYVRYSETKKTESEEMTRFIPAIIDSQSRKIKQLKELQDTRIPNDDVSMEQLPSGLTKSFSALFEVPADATGFSLVVQGLEDSRIKEKLVNLRL